MKSKLKIKKLFIFGLIVSMGCSLYLYTQGSYSGGLLQENPDFIASICKKEIVNTAEVEMMKIFVEKIIDIVTLPAAKLL